MPPHATPSIAVALRFRVVRPWSWWAMYYARACTVLYLSAECCFCRWIKFVFYRETYVRVIFFLKMHENVFDREISPRPAGGAYGAPPDLIDGLIRWINFQVPHPFSILLLPFHFLPSRLLRFLHVSLSLNPAVACKQPQWVRAPPNAFLCISEVKNISYGIKYKTITEKGKEERLKFACLSTVPAILAGADPGFANVADHGDRSSSTWSASLYNGGPGVRGRNPWSWKLFVYFHTKRPNV